MPRDKVPPELLSSISIFVQVGQSDSFTSAARKLNISASGVSRSISRLEERLGVQLVDRTTRSINLTSDGRIYFERCKQILNDLEEAEDAIIQSRSEPSGRLRVRLPRTFGRSVVIPALGKFIARYPQVTLDVRLVSGVIDAVEQGTDVAMQLGKPRDARLIAWKMWPINYVLCASPDYLRQHGTPDTVADLKRHRCLTYIQAETDSYREWTLSERGKSVHFTPNGVLNIDDVHALLDAAIGGAGIAYLMEFVIRDAVMAGKLKVIMPQYAYAGPTSYVVYPPNRFQTNRVKIFVDFLRELTPTTALRLHDNAIKKGRSR
jgi:LysR family transcriptional regulator for bpeEF and oprC